MATSLLSAWALGADGRGSLIVVTMWTSVFSLIATLGLPQAHRYWVARRPEWNSEIFSNTLVYTVAISIVTILFSWQLVPLIVREQRPEIIRFAQVFLFNIPVIVLSEMLRGQLEGGKLFEWLGAARLAFISIQATLYAALYVSGHLTLTVALWIIVGGQIVCAAIMLLAILIKLRPRFRPSFGVFRTEIHYGVRSYAGSLTEFAVWRLDQIMLTALAASTVIGLYAVAVAIAEITVTLGSSVSDALVPEVASSKDIATTSHLLARSLRLNLYAQLIALVPLWIAAPYLLGNVFGAEFIGATGVLRILLIASVFWSAALIIVSGLNGLGHPGLSTLARLASAITTVISLLVLLPTWGMVGAAVSSLLGYGVMLVVGLFFLISRTNLSVRSVLLPRRDDIRFADIRSALGPPFRQPERLGA